jgi:putative hydrolase of the HAD superfamily
VGRAHYRAVRLIDRAAPNSRPAGYLPAFCEALGVPSARLEEAVRTLEEVADREHSGEILWSEPTPHARSTIDALGRAGITVLIVTNSDGHAAENLRDAGICQSAPGPGAVVRDVIDSGVVGSAKPHPAIFRAALRRAGVGPAEAVHVGDMVSTDVVGAAAAGIVPIHLDPYRRCRAADHRHVATLNGIWHHVVAADEFGPSS